MATYEELITPAADQVGIGAADMRGTAQRLVAILYQTLDAQARERVRDALPARLLEGSGPDGPVIRLNSPSDLVDRLADRAQLRAEQARYRAQALLASIRERDPELAATLVSAVPGGSELAEPIGQGPAPRGSGVPIRARPMILEPDEIDRQLAGLTGWTYTGKRLQRHVAVPPERLEPLRNRIAQAERAVDHDAAVRHDGEELVVEVWTHSLDAVTDLDIELARRIDAAVAEVPGA